MPNKPDRFMLVNVAEFGTSGHCPTTRDKWGSSSSTVQGWGDGPEWYQQLVEGGWYVKTKALYNHPDFVRWVMDCPLVDTELKPGETDPLLAEEISPFLLGGLMGSFKSLAVLKKAHPQWKGLDKISVLEYVQYWADKGAPVAQMVDGKLVMAGGEIVWEDAKRCVGDPR